MTPQNLIRMGAAAAVLGGGLRIAAAFIPYTPQSPPLEALYAAIDLSLLLGLTAVYARESGTLGWPGLAAFLAAFAGLASIVGPDATMLGVDWYQAGATVAAIGMAGFGFVSLLERRSILPALCWISVPVLAVLAPLALAVPAAGVMFGLGFVIAGLSMLSPLAAGTS